MITEDALLAELIQLREETIKIVDVSHIPCREISDMARLSQDPLVSVIMITYNHEKYIRDAIEGVLKQKRDFEVELIVAEDCSTDETRRIVREYQSLYPAFIRLLESDQNVGASANLMRAMRVARGRYLALCEGDDGWVVLDKLARQVTAMTNHPSVVLVSTGAQVITHDGCVIEGDAKKYYSDDCLIIGADMFQSLIVSFKLHFFTCSVMIDRLTLVRAEQKHALLHANLFLSDTILWLALALEGNFYHLVQPMVFYRKSYGSVTRSISTGWKVSRDGWLVRYYFARKTGQKKQICKLILRQFWLDQATYYFKSRQGLKNYVFGLVWAAKHKILCRVVVNSLSSTFLKWLRALENHPQDLKNAVIGIL